MRPAWSLLHHTDISAFAAASDRKFAEQLVKEIGVAAVPGSSFYSQPGGGLQQIRFAFCKQLETLDRAIENPRKLLQS